MKTERTDYAELRAAIDAATPGPWAHRNGRIYAADRENLTLAHVARSADGDYSPANAHWIAAASPEVIRSLLADHDAYRRQAQYETDVAHAAFERVKALETERDTLREALEVMVEMVEMNGFGRAYAMGVARTALAQG